jgi:hypothetical protein
MKTRFANVRRQRRSTSGSAIVVLLVLIAIMLALIAANTAALDRLTREVRGLEKRQIQRLDPSAKPPVRSAPEATNQPAGQ